MVGDPPFVGDDAEALKVSEQMFGFQGSLYKFPPKHATPNLAILLTVLKGGCALSPPDGALGEEEQPQQDGADSFSHLLSFRFGQINREHVK